MVGPTSLKPYQKKKLDVFHEKPERDPRITNRAAAQPLTSGGEDGDLSFQSDSEQGLKSRYPTPLVST